MAEAETDFAEQAADFGANWVGPYELSEELRPRIEELGLMDAVEHFREHGYALIREAGPPSLMDELREAIHMYAKVRDKAGGMAGAPMLLGKHPAVDKVATLPKIMAFGEFACGKAMLVGRIVGSIKRKGQGGPGVHSDSNWMPIPLPEHNLLATFCVACEGMTEEGGATMVVPGSHRLRRPPSPEEAQSAKTVCIEAEKGDIAVWDGAIWHGSPERKIDGTRTVLHATYQRLYTQPIDDFRYLLEDEEYMANAPEGMRQLHGADLFFHTAKGETDTDMTKFAYAMEASKV